MEPKIIGYRIENADGEIPQGFPVYAIFSKRIIDIWTESCINKDEWTIIEVFEGDIEYPIIIS